ncbi:alpha/beta hydrolase-fold protein [Corynebacterium falsenii]
MYSYSIKELVPPAVPIREHTTIRPNAHALMHKLESPSLKAQALKLKLESPRPNAHVRKDEEPMRSNANLSRRRFNRRIGAASLALPLAFGLTMPSVVTPAASAQTAAPQLGPGSDTNFLRPNQQPNRTVERVEEQNLPGLPAGVSVEKVEWITNRWANVYINSKAMPGKPIKVQILLARDWYKDPNRTFPSVWALDGLRARDDESGWTLATNIADFYADKNVNVILPVGGESSFFTDWQQPDNGKHYMWETFLTKELPPVLSEGWRTNNDRAIVGLSMGGTAAMNLAERFPQMFKFVGSFSGYLDTTSYGMPMGIDYATHDGGGYDAKKMWGPYYSQDWIDHDPKLGVDKLKNMGVYVSAGNGNTGQYDHNGPIPGIPDNMAGFGLEVMSRLTTQTFVNYANRAGVNVITAFRPAGTHSWPYWQFEMTQAWPHIAKSLNLGAEDTTATCVPSGAIGDKWPSIQNEVGPCVSPEYDAPNGGRVQDFRSGRAYWTPATGAQFMWGRIGARYAGIGGPSSFLGYPTDQESAIGPNNAGRIVHFQNGAIYWSHETGAVEIKSDMFAKYRDLGYEKGALGYPTEPEKEVAGGSVMKFQNGAILRRPDGGVVAVQGPIAQKYFADGGPESGLGWPTSDQRAIPAGGEEIDFQHGNIKLVNGQIQESR